MSGYAFCVGHCYGCKQLFTFNPLLVPSIDIQGSKEPICQSCAEKANPVRTQNGLDPITPLPGAYDACPEEELL
jgi:hypothetical protein